MFQQDDVIRLGCGRGGRFRLLAVHGADQFDGEEDGEGDDQEVNGSLEQFSIPEFHVSQLKGQERKVHAGREVADDGRDDAGNEYGDDFVERAADDDGHGQVNNIAFQRESLEFLQESLGIKKMCHSGLMLLMDLF